MARRDSHYLIPGSPLIVLRELACEIGLNESLVLQQLYWRQCSYEEDQRFEYRLEGHWGERGSYPHLRDRHFPFWSARTIQRVCEALAKMDLLIVTPLGTPLPNEPQIFHFHVNAARIQTLAKAPIPTEAKPQKARRKAEGWSKPEAPARQVVQPPLDNLSSGNEDSAGQLVTRPPDKLSSEKETSARQVDAPAGQVVARAYHYSALETPNETHTDSSNNKTARAQGENGAPTDPESAPEAEQIADEKAVVVALLTQHGVTTTIAQALAEAHSQSAIREQIAALPYRKAAEPGAVLVKAIRESWALPHAFLEARKAARRQERAAARRVRPAPPVAAPTVVETDPAQEAAEIALWTFGFTLSDAEQAAVDVEARERLSSIFQERYDRAVKAGGRLPDSLQPIWDATRREVLREWMARHDGDSQPRDDLPAASCAHSDLTSLSDRKDPHS